METNRKHNYRVTPKHRKLFGYNLDATKQRREEIWENVKMDVAFNSASSITSYALNITFSDKKLKNMNMYDKPLSVFHNYIKNRLLQYSKRKSYDGILHFELAPSTLRYHIHAVIQGYGGVYDLVKYCKRNFGHQCFLKQLNNNESGWVDEEGVCRKGVEGWKAYCEKDFHKCVMLPLIIGKSVQIIPKVNPSVLWFSK